MVKMVKFGFRVIGLVGGCKTFIWGRLERKREGLRKGLEERAQIKP